MRKLSQVSKSIVSDIFKKQSMLIHMGAELVAMDYGEVSVLLPKHQLGLQHHGYFHGGIVTTLADTAGGLAACSLLTDPKHSSITVELKINFLNPCKGNFLLAKGKVIREGNLVVCTAQVYSQQILCAYLLQTNKKLILI